MTMYIITYTPIDAATETDECTVFANSLSDAINQFTGIVWQPLNFSYSEYAIKNILVKEVER